MARSGQAEGIAGYATFHGGLATPEGQSYPADMPPLLVAHGGADSSVTMDHVAALSRELEAAGLDYQIEVYSGAPHAFTVFDSDRYRDEADRKSWEEFQAFLAANLADGCGLAERASDGRRGRSGPLQIGRASCRARVCQYV